MGDQHQNRPPARCKRRRLQSRRLHPPAGRRRFRSQPVGAQLPKTLSECSVGIARRCPSKSQQIFAVSQDALCVESLGVSRRDFSWDDMQREARGDSFGMCVVVDRRLVTSSQLIFYCTTYTGILSLLKPHLGVTAMPDNIVTCRESLISVTKTFKGGVSCVHDLPR